MYIYDSHELHTPTSSQVPNTFQTHAHIRLDSLPHLNFNSIPLSPFLGHFWKPFSYDKNISTKELFFKNKFKIL